MEGYGGSEKWETEMLNQTSVKYWLEGGISSLVSIPNPSIPQGKEHIKMLRRLLPVSSDASLLAMTGKGSPGISAPLPAFDWAMGGDSIRKQV